MATRTRVTFAGTTFSGFQHGENHITVPTNVLVKILLSGKVLVKRNHRFTDDYAWDAANNHGKVDNFDPIALAKEVTETGKPWLCYLNPHENLIRYCPMQSESYTIVPKTDTE